MADLSEFDGSGTDGVRTGGELAGQPLRPSGRRWRWLAPLAAALALAGLVAVWVPLHRSAPVQPAHAVGPLAGSPGPSAGISMVDSPVADPTPLRDGPLAPAALLYARCGGMGAVGGEFPEDCRYRLVLTDGSQYTLPISATAFGPGSVSPDGTFLLMRDNLESLVLRHLPSGTSRRVTVPGLENSAAWGPVVWSPGARHAAVVVVEDDAVAVIDTASASVQRTVDLAAVATAGHYEAGQVTDPFAVAADGGELSWARLAETSMTLIHWGADEQRASAVNLDVRPHLRPGEILVDLGRGLLLGDGVTAAVPVGRADEKIDSGPLPQVSGDTGQGEQPQTDVKTEPPALPKAYAILLVDVTTGAVRHRQELPTAITAEELHGSGRGFGPDALVVAEADVSNPDRPSISPAELTSLNPWTGARGSGYRLSPQGLFPVLAC